MLIREFSADALQRDDGNCDKRDLRINCADLKKQNDVQR